MRENSCYRINYAKKRLEVRHARKHEASFSFADGVYGSTFFIATGFHGLHVIVGTLFLGVCLLRHLKGEFRINHHFGFEAAA